MPPAMMIQTHRLLLRPWKNTDLEPFAAMNADPKVMEFFPAMLTRQESDALVARYQLEFSQRGYGLWAVEVKGKVDFIGFIGLHYQNFPAPFTPCIEVGWRLANPYWGQGYGIEGAEAALSFGFNEIDLPEIVSFTSEKNMRSRHLMERLGMKRNPSDDFEHPALPAGHPLKRHVLYRLSKAEFKKQTDESKHQA